MPNNRRTPQRGAGPRNTRPGQRGGSTRSRTSGEAIARPKFTNRAAILVLILAVLVVSWASSMRAYLQQRSTIDGLRSQIASSQAAIGSMKTEKNRWADPAYVETQARERFGWVLPGETAYQVLDQNGQPLANDDVLTNPDDVAPAVPQAWWSKAYGSLEAADHPKKALPPPATKITAPSTSTKQ